MVFQTISDNIRDFVRDEHGASSSEYALILGVIGVGVGAATLMLGANVGASMNGKAASFDPGFTGGSDTGSAGGGNGNGSGGNGGSGTGGSTGGGTDTGSGNNGNGNGNGGGNPKAGGNGKNK
ncbi:MAG: hypothetical protein CL820_17405 [Croceicoccus sp.]|nr:hypothetical protein [Croceicoccus sp.]MAL27629.1 hypothetical protein [Croceicoccus sp.]|tara:strand:+ start:231 stop:599 length:369 start_codon:yes stop_codon:yes gene_type:complete